MQPSGWGNAVRRLVAFGTALSTIGAAGWLGFGTAAADEKLNEQGYIIPGLGDAGDRMFGTK